MVESVYWKKADGTGAGIQYPYYQSKKRFRTSQYIVVWKKNQDVLPHSITFAVCKAACFSGCCHPQFLAQAKSNWGAEKAQNYITLYPLCTPNLTPTTVACRGLLAIYSWKLPSQHPHFRVSQTWWKLFIGCPQKKQKHKGFLPQQRLVAASLKQRCCSATFCTGVDRGRWFPLSHLRQVFDVVFWKKYREKASTMPHWRRNASLSAENVSSPGSVW